MRKIALLFALILFFGAYEVFEIYKQPLSYGEKIVDIPEHMSLRAVAALLQQEGVLKTKWSLIVLAKISNASNKIQSGEFSFHTPSSPKNALDTLLHGAVILHKATFPEGSTITEMAVIMTEANINAGADFVHYTRDADLLKEFYIPSDRFEGHLFPSTYFFSKHEKPKKIIQVMHDELQKNLNPEDEQKAAAYGWNTHQWLTFASIIEKETGNFDEYALVSSVFHNRLKIGMALQTDPSVIYGIENFDGNIRKKDLLTDTPYNTYTRKGLPPTPICNPGAAAIHAAVNPAPTHYFYFVGNQKGVHVFSNTYKEHLKAVQRYQLHHKGND